MSSVPMAGCGRGRPSGWSQVTDSPELERITVSNTSGLLWATTKDFDVVMFDPVANQWKSRGDGGKGKDICAANNALYVIGMNDHVWKNTGPSGWAQLPGEGMGKRIAVDPLNDRIWLIGWHDGILAARGRRSLGGTPGRRCRHRHPDPQRDALHRRIGPWAVAECRRRRLATPQRRRGAHSHAAAPPDGVRA